MWPAPSWQVFLAAGTVAAHLAAGILYAAIGLAITAMLSGVSASAVRPAVPAGRGGPDDHREPHHGRYDADYGTHDPQAPHTPWPHDPGRR